ncbi:MAG: T9SS type A sorting domain-containing protein [Crocinitomix sp.]|nr:T9SS type A sorting domain-containing protein [Crocinitomix sp.]
MNGEDGSEAWEILVDDNSWVQTAPTLVDLNSDGQLDFVVATWNFDYLDSVFAYNGADQTLMWSYPIHDHVYHGTAVADFDSDGNPELLIGSYNDTLYCINGEDGTTDWKYKGPGGYIGSPASIGDVDADGICEVVLTNGYKVSVLENDGTLKWDYTIPEFSSAFRGVALSDVNNDENLDIVFCSLKGKVIGLDGLDGAELWTVDLADHYGDPLFELNHAPLIVDFDNDGNLDVFVVGGHAEYPDIHLNFGRAYMLSIGPGSGPDWLIFQHDIRRQSSLCPFPFAGVDLMEETVDEFAEVLLYPNPAHSSITLEFPHEINSKYNLTIFRANGQLIQLKENPSSNPITVALADWANGLYFYQVQFFDGNIERGKFIVEH